MSFILKSQSQELPTVIPPSPDASAMTKHVDIPTNNYTGIPNISIPIHTIKTRELSVPISLSYHASGVKVDDIPAWVGMNWSLNYGGIINRTIKGKADESNGGYLTYSVFEIEKDYDNNNPLILPLTDDYCELGNWTFPYADEVSEMTTSINRIAANMIDGQPDVFSFSFNGYSGKFYFDTDGEIVLFSEQDLFIEDPFIANNEIKQWTVVTGDGTKYIFGSESINGIEYSGHEADIEIYPSAWYITKIISADGSDDINYTYYDPQNNETQYWYLKENVANGENNYNYMPGDQEYNVIKVKKIFPEEIQFHNSSKIVFNRASCNGSVLQSLNSIEVWSEGIKKLTYELTYHEHQLLGDGLAPDDKFSLETLVVKDNSGKTRNLYEFTYDEQLLPPRGSFEQDLWGYYNGQINNEWLVPTIVQENAPVIYAPAQFNPPCPDYLDCWEELLTNTSFDSNLENEYSDFNDLIKIKTRFGGHEVGKRVIENANREPDSLKMQAGILKSIKYPTGGYSHFEYEPHDFSFFTREETKETKDISLVNEYLDDKTYYLYLEGSQEVDLRFLLVFFNPNAPVTDNNKVSFKKYDYVNNIFESYREITSRRNWDYPLNFRVWLDKGYYKIIVDPEESFGIECHLNYKPGNGYNKTYKVSDDDFDDTDVIINGLTVPDDESIPISEEFEITQANGKELKIEFTFQSPLNPNVYNPNNKTIFTIKKKYAPYTEVFRTEYYPCNDCTGDDFCEYCGFIVNPAPVNLDNYMQQGEETIELEAGKYILDFIPRIETEYGYCKVTYQKYKDRSFSIKTGGNRIRKITMDDGEGNTIEKEFIYKLHDDNNEILEEEKPDGEFAEVSSGVLVDYPRLYNLPESNVIYWLDVVPGGDPFPIPNIEIFGSPTTPMSTTNGGHIGYREVEIRYKNNSKSIYEYTSSVEHPDITNYTYPYPDPISFDWKRGKLIKETHIDNSGKTIQETQHNYSPLNDILNPYISLNGNNTKLVPAIVAVRITDNTSYNSKYALLSDVSLLNKTINSQLTNTDTIKTEQDFYYKKKKLKRTKSYGSDNKVIENKIYHEEDYNYSTNSIQPLRDNHIHDVPVKTESIVDGKLANSKVIEYNGYGKPLDVSFHESTELSDTTPHDPQTLPPVGFNKRIEYQYGTEGQIKDVKKVNNQYISYFWGYSNAFPVAKIIGIEYNDIPSGAITELEKLDDVSVNLDQVNTNIRSLLPDCMVTTYTYNPLFGIKTETDPAGKTVYYDYDSFGRLIIIKDQDGVVLKRIEYNYVNDN